MRLAGWIGSVVLVCCSAFASAETLQIKGPDNILDGYVSVTYSYHEFGLNVVKFREYWWNNGTYDCRTLFRVDLSAIPEGTEIDSVAFKLKVNPITSNTSSLGVDLWQMSPFNSGATATTCDGTNPWPNGSLYDGVDGYYRTPQDRILATTPISKTDVDSFVEFSGSKLNDYIQTQADLAAGERYAYFQMSWPDKSCEVWGAFYSSEAGEYEQPYLEISWGGSTNFPGDANGDGMVDVGDLGILAGNYGTTEGATWIMGDFNGDGAVDVGDLGILAGNYGASAATSVPEPASLGLIGMGIFALLRRKR